MAGRAAGVVQGSTTVAVAAARPRRMVFGVGSRFFPKSRMSVGFWALGELLGSSARWRVRDDLLAEVAEVGDTVYVRPLVHILHHNAVPLVRVQEFLGLAAEKVTIVHYDSELELGKYTMAFGGRTRNNEALKIAAAALKEEGFGRLGLGVAKGEVFEGMFVQGFRGVSDTRMQKFWLCNRLPESAFDLLRESVLEKVGRDLTGNTRASSVFDATKRL